jgi:hypothetical protein
MTQTAIAPWTSSDSLQAMRPEIASLLLAVPAFAQMSESERKTLAANTLKVMSYIANPNGVASEIEAQDQQPAVQAQAVDPVAARALEDAVENTKQSLSSSPGFAGKDFEGGAIKQGVEQFGEMVKKVDFPKFVGGLIKNVFQAIVESSIEQMRAYGELISNVAKTVDQFMQDNISAAAGRDYLAEKFPDALSVETGAMAGSMADGDDPAAASSTSRVTAKGENAAIRLAEISQQMYISPPITDLSDANAELRLVTAARLEMAKSRQKLLSSMVMLGINRIVVTDGSITAKVVFDMRASDRAKRNYSASMADVSSQSYKEKVNAEYGSWYTPVSASASFEGQQDHVATVASAVDESSESKAEVKAKLSGEVRVNFKSDYLPLDKMATPEMMSVIQGNSTPYNPNQPAAGATAPSVPTRP